MKKLWQRIVAMFQRQPRPASEAHGMRAELIAALKANIELKTQLQQKRYELVSLPTDETMPQFLEAIEFCCENRWLQTFFIMRERELLTKFKSGADGELLRGALVCLDDLRTAMAEHATKSKAWKAQKAAQ